jgi:hypothetical protein
MGKNLNNNIWVYLQIQQRGTAFEPAIHAAISIQYFSDCIVGTSHMPQSHNSW